MNFSSAWPPVWWNVVFQNKKVLGSNQWAWWVLSFLSVWLPPSKDKHETNLKPVCTNKFFTAEKSKAHTVFLYQCFLKAIANETLVLPIMLDMSILSGGKLLVGFLVRPWLAVWWCHTHCGFFPGSVFGSGILYSVGWFYRWGVLLSGFTGCGSKVWRLKEFLKS